VSGPGGIGLDTPPDPPPMWRMSAIPDHRWASTPEAVAELGVQMGGLDHLTLDTESNSRFVYRERVCLTQCNLDGELVLIDNLDLPCDPEALAPLKPALEDPAIACFLHGGEYDVACLKRDYDIALRGVFDTQQAASMLGFAKTGYGAVVEAVTGHQLPKGHSTYDWGRRPIDHDALRYALDDVRLLPEVALELRRRVAEAGLEEEVAIANRAVEDVDAHNNQFDPAGIYRIKGVGRLGRDKLAVLVAIYHWRDERAREADLPPGRLLNNEAMLQIARFTPTNYSSLKRARINGRVLRNPGDGLLATIKAALADRPAIPDPPARREADPREQDREKTLKAWRRQEAEQRGVPLQVVLPARALEYLVREPDAAFDQVPQLGPKRTGFYGSQLRRLLKK